MSLDLIGWITCVPVVCPWTYLQGGRDRIVYSILMKAYYSRVGISDWYWTNIYIYTLYRYVSGESIKFEIVYTCVSMPWENNLCLLSCAIAKWSGTMQNLFSNLSHWGWYHRLDFGVKLLVVQGSFFSVNFDKFNENELSVYQEKDKFSKMKSLITWKVTHRWGNK